MEIEGVEIPEDLSKKIDIIKEQFRGKNILVAFSGGLDSSLVCYLANIFGKKMLAIMVNTIMTPTIEVTNAKEISSKLHFPLKIKDVDISSQYKIISNGPNRCYYCKKKILMEIYDIGRYEKQIAHNFDIFVDGTNYSDLNLSRPGIRALNESIFHSPLVDAKITKDEIRLLSKILDLPSKRIPSQACLASRIPFGISLSKELLKMVDLSENYIRKTLDNYNSILRVRVHQMSRIDKYLARIEGDDTIYHSIFKDNNRQKIVKKLIEFGFLYVTVDLLGFKSGSMHETILGRFFE